MADAKFPNGPWRREKGTTVVWSSNCYDAGTGNVGCVVARAARPESWRGTRPTIDEQIAIADAIAALPDMFEALRCAKDLLDNINEFGVCTSPEIYDAADTAVRAALDKVLGNE